MDGRITPSEFTSTPGYRSWSETRTFRHRRKAVAFDPIRSRAALGSPYPGELSSAARGTRLLDRRRESDPERAPNESRGNSRASTYCHRVESSHPNTFRSSRAACRVSGCYHPLTCAAVESTPRQVFQSTDHLDGWNARINPEPNKKALNASKSPFAISPLLNRSKAR
jgi:hypothetical protein